MMEMLKNIVAAIFAVLVTVVIAVGACFVAVLPLLILIGGAALIIKWVFF